MKKWKKFIIGCFTVFSLSAFAVSSSNAALTTEMPGNYSFVGTIDFGTETLTTSAANPGVGTASASIVYTAIITDDTGAATDTVSLLDGATAGQIHIFTLRTDGEAAGCAVTPVNFGAGTDVLFETVGDGCVMVWDGDNWQIVSNNGGTIR